MKMVVHHRNLCSLVYIVGVCVHLGHGQRASLGDSLVQGIHLNSGIGEERAGFPPNRDVDHHMTATGVHAASRDTCTAEYREIPGHTMCLTDKPQVIREGVTPEEKAIILRLHNEARASARPSASDLTTMVWNDDLAAVAQKWAKQCIMGHDKERSIPGLGVSVGQNVAGGYRTWERAIGGWEEEVKMYVYGREPDTYLGTGGWVKIGHYTQMVQNTTHMVGCGFAACRGTQYGRYFVCNYAAA
ncbi:hypothetical protein C0Q70_03982 [Pomacea canaliculata]|uniref:SCP domain-containing protein n=2 Tax=Pomacea canaliculata TaxID=400727 RepID=A0A2T7PUA2_POMCA|nr:hypothetical protein C0Q70_03982 [Pomacea canaliculata]